MKLKDIQVITLKNGVNALKITTKDNIQFYRRIGMITKYEINSSPNLPVIEMTYPELEFKNIEKDIKEFYNQIKKNNVGAGGYYKYKDSIVQIEVAPNETWLHYDEYYQIQCVKDKLNNLSKYDFSDNERDAVRKVLYDLLKQME